jgi:hypothetical protein
MEAALDRTTRASRTSRRTLGEKLSGSAKLCEPLLADIGGYIADGRVLELI